MKLLVVAFLYDDDNIVSHPLVGSLVRSGSRFLMTRHNRGQILYESRYVGTGLMNCPAQLQLESQESRNVTPSFSPCVQVTDSLH